MTRTAASTIGQPALGFVPGYAQEPHDCPLSSLTGTLVVECRLSLPSSSTLGSSLSIKGRPESRTSRSSARYLSASSSG